MHFGLGSLVLLELEWTLAIVESEFEPEFENCRPQPNLFCTCFIFSVLMELECTQVDGTLSYPVEPDLGPSLIGVTHLVPQGNRVGST